MINNIYSLSKHVVVTSSVTTYIYISNNSGMAGSVRFNPITQNIEINDGHNWIQYESPVSVDLSSTAHAALDWANKKMQQEAEYATLASQHSSVQDALDNVVKAQERLDIIIALTKEEKNHV